MDDCEEEAETREPRALPTSLGFSPNCALYFGILRCDFHSADLATECIGIAVRTAQQLEVRTCAHQLKTFDPRGHAIGHYGRLSQCGHQIIP